MRLVLWFVIAVIFSGCAATGPEFKIAPPDPNGKAVLYIYRPAAYPLRGLKAGFSVDGINAAELSVEGYSFVYLSPGLHRLTHQWVGTGTAEPVTEISVRMEAGSSSYVRFVTDHGTNCGVGKICFRWQLEQLSQEAARPQIEQCRLETAKVLSPSR